MNWFPDLTGRQLEPEIMDDPDLDRDRHLAALAGLSRLNRLSRSTQIVWGPIRQLAAERPQARLRVLDIATGGGDIPLGLWRLAQRRRIALELTAVDLSPLALELAQQRAERAGAPIRFQAHDVLAAPLDEEFDVVMCSLFLHHLQRRQALGLLQTMAASARELVLVNDLRRGRWGYLLAHAAGRLFTRSPVVHVDGPLSVRAAFTIPEVRQLAAEAGLDAHVTKRWPCRFLMQWRKPGVQAR